MHLVDNMVLYLSQILTYIYHAYYISNQAYIYYASISTKRICDRYLNIKNPSSNQSCSYSLTKSYSKQMHVHINAWLTLLYHSTYASMHVHGISKKEKKRNPNLACEEQTTNKIWRQRLISIKKIKTKAYKIKKWKQKGLD